MRYANSDMGAMTEGFGDDDINKQEELKLRKEVVWNVPCLTSSTRSQGPKDVHAYANMTPAYLSNWKHSTHPVLFDLHVLG